MSDESRSVDVLIVGSGPIGSAYARQVADADPRASILMVEVGPQLTDLPGMHVQNIDDEEERSQAQSNSEGPARVLRPDEHGTLHLIARQATGGPGSQGDVAAVAGTYLIEQDGVPKEQQLGFSASSNVGGMGAHWAALTPTPDGRELVPFIPREEWDPAFEQAKRLLGVRVHPGTSQGWHDVFGALGREFDPGRPAHRRVQPCPMAARARPGSRMYLTGTDVILGDLATAPPETFTLASETLCRHLLVDGPRVRGAMLEHLPSGRSIDVQAKVVVVAADALRTPQVLWASEIRPDALGRHLHDHTALVGGMTKGGYEAMELMQRGMSSERAWVGWIPYVDDLHPFHSAFPYVEFGDEEGPDALRAMFVGCLLPKDGRYEDRVRFSDSQLDFYGMPGMSFDYSLTKADEELADAAMAHIARASEAVSEYFDMAVPPMRLALGSSLHYQSTVRMGEHDDGSSVCDSHSKVWGFHNLFVGGNGVIPSPIACNPTLTSVALAVRSSESVLAALAEAG